MKTGKLDLTQLELPIMNACETCTTIEELEALLRLPIPFVVIGSVTLNDRRHRLQARYVHANGYSLATPGLINPGKLYYMNNLARMVSMIRAQKKHVVVSLAGADVTEFLDLATLMRHVEVDMVEINLSTPELQKKGAYLCYDLREVDLILTAMSDALSRPKSQLLDRIGADRNITPLSVRIAPFSDPALLEEFAAVVSAHSAVHAVTAVAPFPNAFGYTPEGNTVFKYGLGGLSGPALLPIALGQVFQLKQLLPFNVKLIGTGGITTPRDAADFLRAGAVMVRVNSELLNGAGLGAIYQELVRMRRPKNTTKQLRS